MPDLVFEVACKACGRTLAKAERIRDPEIDTIRDHMMSVCARGNEITDRSPLGELLAHTRVTRATE